MLHPAPCARYLLAIGFLFSGEGYPTLTYGYLKISDLKPSHFCAVRGNELCLAVWISSRRFSRSDGLSSSSVHIPFIRNISVSMISTSRLAMLGAIAIKLNPLSTSQLLRLRTFRVCHGRRRNARPIPQRLRLFLVWRMSSTHGSRQLPLAPRCNTMTVPQPLTSDTICRFAPTYSCYLTVPYHYCT
ncbi:hypothetical protein B0H21DRAFT_756674 [Amylocystis lapponica]|nr:hypothetical protein B0H21DRAFT_756674 [Amylocystis lapponica]